jgi:hypothetical protein
VTWVTPEDELNVSRIMSGEYGEEYLYYVRFEVFTALTMKNVIFWNVMPCRSCVNRRFGGTYGLHLQSRDFHSGDHEEFRLPGCGAV